MQARVSVGLPVYNGEATLAAALDSLLNQTFADYELIVSDNASSDNTKAICKDYASRDKRIQYCRQSKNLGALANFSFVLKEANTDLFMWAAADDEWTLDFLKRCVHTLDTSPNVGFTSGRIQNIDSNGRVLRSYPPLRGMSSSSPSCRIARFAAMRECDGKANMIHSVFRTKILRRAWEGVYDCWGVDMVFVASALSCAPYQQTNNATMFKRVTTQIDISTCKALSAGNYDSIDFAGHYPLRYAPSYILGHWHIISGNRARIAAAAALISRLPQIIWWRVLEQLRRARRPR